MKDATSRDTSRICETGIDLFLRYALLLSFLALYLLFLTRDYYWDGIAFAESIESRPTLGPHLLHPNHLVYNIFGFFAFRLLHTIGLTDRALYALQIANALISTLTLYMFSRVLCHLFRSTGLALLLTSLFALSATWWKFSTDADSYVSSILFLVISFYLILPPGPVRPGLLGLTHAVAMLFHQLAVLFYPVALFGIVQQRAIVGSSKTLHRLLLYCSVSTGFVVLAYVSAFYWSFGSFDLSSFMGWVVSYSPEVSFAFTLGRNLLASLRGTVRLFLGGRLAILRDLPVAFTVPALMALAVIIISLVFTLFRYRNDLRQWCATWRRREALSRVALRLCIAWIVPYVLFLSVWLPHNSFYRLFYLPPIILLPGIVIADYRRHGFPRRVRLVLCVLAIGLSNFVFVIYPRSRIETNKPLTFALRLGEMWGETTRVYYRTYDPDNWLIRYFNPRTEWRELNVSDLASLETEVKALHARGLTAWLDNSGAHALRNGPSSHREWFRRHVREENMYALVEGRQNIRFYRIEP